MKETFIVRTEWSEAILELPEADQALIFRNLFYFHSGQENLINLNNLSVKLVWKLIAPNLQRNIESYDRRKDTSSANGALGGRPKKVEDKPKKPNSEPNETKEPKESLSDTVFVPVSETDPEIEFVDGKFILSEMVSIYREHVEGYPYDPENDNKALGAIIKAIKVQAEIKTDPATDQKARDEVLICWRQMSMSISKDSFYKDMGLKTIANNITTIFLKTKNGSANSKNGTSNSRGNAQSFYDAASGFNRKGE